MVEKYIVFIDTENSKKYIKYFPINLSKYNISSILKQFLFTNDNKIIKMSVKKNMKGDFFWQSRNTNLNKTDVITELTNNLNEKYVKLYRNIAYIIVKKNDAFILISNKIFENYKINMNRNDYLNSIKIKKIHDIIVRYINSSRKNIIGGTGGTLGTKDMVAKRTLNPSANPFPDPYGFNRPKSPKTPESPKTPKSPESPKSPKSPIVDKECFNVLRQIHTGKKEYILYNSYRYDKYYLDFKQHNSINISIPTLLNFTKNRKSNEIQVVEIEKNKNGITSIGANIYNRYSGSNPPKIGTLIAANSGRPGGGCGNFDGTIGNIHQNHRTQEEDIMSNWFMTYSNNKNIIDEDEKKKYYNKLFQCTIFNRWGLLYPTASRDDRKNYYKTIQGINYRYAVPKDYADAWTVENVYLSDKNYHYKQSQYIYENQYKTTLVFVSGPNNNNPGTKGQINSVFRTYNDMTAISFSKFMEGVEAALFAGLISMIQSKCTIALLVYVSGGIYRGLHNIDDYRNMFENIVNNLLTHVQINGLELGSYFDAVYLI